MYDILYGINQPRAQRGAGVWGERGMGGPYIYIIYIGAPHVPHVSAILYVVTRVTKTNHHFCLWHKKQLSVVEPAHYTEKKNFFIFTV